MTHLQAWIAELAAAADSAEAAEAAYRAESARCTAALAEERAFAYRRVNLLRALAEAVTGAPDEETAMAHGLAMLRARLGWSSTSDARDEIVGRFAPVCVALRAADAPDDGEEDAGDGAEEAPPDPAEALAAFEGWYREARGTPFWKLFETYIPETPLVDW
jgi:hypothetical protein